ncbi:hypothetical protein TRVL_09389 [Trypanosoma vivax]|nr:hypothetical protein TRVL_09389 [Trypanosoma vivax]
MSLTIASAHFPRKAGVSSESLDILLGASGPWVLGGDVNSHHVLWDPFRPSDDKGQCEADWCMQNSLSIANADKPPGGNRPRQHCRHRASRFVETARSPTGSPL